jgi:nicotinate dehydrogenase subunit B
MSATSPGGISRRGLLKGGALIVSFSLLPHAFAQDEFGGATAPGEAELPGSLDSNRFLDAWIKVDADGHVTVFTGKAELGQGIKTSLRQIAAEELEVEFQSLTLITADTARTPNEGFTAGSHSIQDSGTAIRNAAAQVREILVAEAARRLAVAPDQLRAENGAVVTADGKKFGYGELVGENLLHVEAQPTSRLKDPKAFKVMGQSIQRVDIPAKVTGGEAYVQDMRPEGMLHARVVRPPSPGARLTDLDQSVVAALPGIVKIVRDGSYIAVVAEQEFVAIEAMRMLALAAKWQETATQPDPTKLFETIQSLPATDLVVKDAKAPVPAGAKVVSASFTRPYQMHASIGPSCAVGLLKDGTTTVWTHTQGVYPDRAAIAEMLDVPNEQVRCIHTEGSGCYGHNGADDVAADAALIARAVPGRAVRVQWMREQENGWEPYGPAMVTKVNAALDHGGNIVDWNYEVWSNPHTTRPGKAGTLLPARYLASPFVLAKPPAVTNIEGSGDRNSIPLYKLPSLHVIWHFLADMPVRVSALRSLGAYMNVFSIESFMDELAEAAETDPVEFRLKYLDDPRARDVVMLAAEKFGWSSTAMPPGRGRGFAFARYKNLASYFAIACEVEVEHETGRVRMARAVAAIDSGEVVNPDGVINQSEGGILQSMSWTLYESVAFDQTRINSIDWSTYPILRFSAVPDSIEVHIIPRPGQPFLGAGEAAQGPTGAAVANAVADATGKRLRDLPLTRARVKAEIGI